MVQAGIQVVYNGIITFTDETVAATKTKQCFIKNEKLIQSIHELKGRLRHHHTINVTKQ